MVTEHQSLSELEETIHLHPCFHMPKATLIYHLMTILTEGEAVDVAFSSDGTQIVSGSEYGSVQVWDASTGVELMKLGHKVKSVAFSSDSMWIVSGSYDHYLQVWDVSAGVELMKLKISLFSCIFN